MTEHRTAELKRQYQEACIVLLDATSAMSKAREAYANAQCADLLAGFEAQGGVIGKTRVRGVEWDGRVNKHKGPFLVIGAECASLGCGVRFNLAKIKKDGTASKATFWQSTEVAILPEDQE